MHKIFPILNPHIFYFLDLPQACFIFLKINDKISQCLVGCLNHMLIMYNNQNATMDFCPRDSGPMVLHYACRQILTYALKVRLSQVLSSFLIRLSSKNLPSLPPCKKKQGSEKKTNLMHDNQYEKYVKSQPFIVAGGILHILIHIYIYWVT